MSKKQEKFISLASVEAKEVEWLLPPFIPFGMITIMEGDPGVGKSYLAMHIASEISIGGKLPNTKLDFTGDVLYLSAEDSAEYTIKPRVEAMGGDPSQIRIQASLFDLDEQGMEDLAHEVAENMPDLIIIDSLYSYVPGSKDAFRPNVMRAFLSQLNSIAEMENTAILIIRHLTKTKQSKSIYQGSGTMDVIAMARSAFLVGEDPNDPKTKVVAHLKYNLSEQGDSWSYQLVKRKDNELPKLKWVGKTDLTVEDLLSNPNKESQTALDQAIQFLTLELEQGPELTKIIEDRAENRNISLRTIERARKKLGIVARNSKKGWVVSLPDKK